MPFSCHKAGLQGFVTGVLCYHLPNEHAGPQITPLPVWKDMNSPNVTLPMPQTIDGLVFRSNNRVISRVNLQLYAVVEKTLTDCLAASNNIELLRTGGSHTEVAKGCRISAKPKSLRASCNQKGLAVIRVSQKVRSAARCARQHSSCSESIVRHAN